MYSKQDLFSDHQAITATAASSNVRDLGAAKDFAAGDPVPLTIQVTEDFATLTSLTVAVQEATDAAFTTPVTLATSAAIAAADLVAGYKFPLRFLPTNAKRYLRLYYTVAGTNATAGKIFAGVGDEQNNKP